MESKDSGGFSGKCDQLIKTVASIKSQIDNLANCSELSDSIKFWKTVNPELCARLPVLQAELVRTAWLATGKQGDKPSVKNLDLDYSTKVADLLEKHLMEAGFALDRIRQAVDIKSEPGRERHPQGLFTKKPRLQVETDGSRISLPTNKQIFVPDSHPFADQMEQMYRETISLPTIIELKPKILLETHFEYIDDLDDLKRIAKELEQFKLLAVDLENHTFMSYYGFSCLLQLSTVAADYIIDTIVLRDHIGPILAPIFSNPNILKVFHGAKGDIAWLQRDFNIFVVNMFDTYIASRKLGFPSHSFAYLLHKYCQIQTDKSLQLADWRVRPLPEAMIQYARMDTHNLLYIFSMLYRELLESGSEAALEVFRGSTQETMALYRPDSFNVESWRSIINKSSASFGEREVKRIKIIHLWREWVARKEDLSPPAVLPNHIIGKLAQASFSDPLAIIEAQTKNLAAARKHLDLLKISLMDGSFSKSLDELSMNFIARPAPPLKKETSIKPVVEQEISKQKSFSEAKISIPTLSIERQRKVVVAALPSESIFGNVQMISNQRTINEQIVKNLSLNSVVQASKDLDKIERDNSPIGLEGLQPEPLTENGNLKLLDEKASNANLEDEEQDRLEDIINMASKQPDTIINLTNPNLKRKKLEPSHQTGTIELKLSAQQLLSKATRASCNPTNNTLSSTSATNHQMPTDKKARTRPIKLGAAPKSGNRSMSFFTYPK